MAARAKSRRACGPSFVFLARPRSCEALKSPRNATGIAMTNLHRSPPMNQSKTDLGIVNESQLLRLGIRACRRWRGPEPPQRRHHRACPGDPRLPFFTTQRRRGWPVKPGHDDVETSALYAAAAIDFRKPSISACRLVVESDNCFADDNSWLDAGPVWLAPWLTSAMVPATCEVPSAVRWIFPEISWVAAPCSSIAADIALVISEILPMVELIILIEPTASCVAVCMPAI